MDDIDQLRHLAGAAMQSMAAHDVPPSPANFTVWFQYHLGDPKPLKQTIDVLLANKHAIDKAVSRDLFAMYMSSARETAGIEAQQTEHIAGIIADAQQYLVSAIAGNRQQITSLDGLTAESRAARDPHLLVERLVSNLTSALGRATSLEQSFVATSKELEVVRQSFSAAEERANVDELTGLANRRALDAFLRAVQTSAMEQGTPFCVLLFDIDHFKKFNDMYGHQTGDHVLRLVAAILKGNTRDGDLAARYGGEEMMIVLPNADLAQAAALSERIRITLSERKLRRRSTGEELCSVTTSVGVAQFRPGESIEQLVGRSDRALYAAKFAGRNRTCTEEHAEAA